MREGEEQVLYRIARQQPGLLRAILHDADDASDCKWRRVSAPPILDAKS